MNDVVAAQAVTAVHACDQIGWHTAFVIVSMLVFVWGITR